MDAANLTVPGLLLTAVTGLLGTIVFLWRHYEARLKEKDAENQQLEAELKTELKGRLRDQELFAKALERKRTRSSSDSDSPSPIQSG